MVKVEVVVVVVVVVGYLQNGMYGHVVHGTAPPPPPPRRVGGPSARFSERSCRLR